MIDYTFDNCPHCHAAVESAAGYREPETQTFIPKLGSSLGSYTISYGVKVYYELSPCGCRVDNVYRDGERFHFQRVLTEFNRKVREALNLDV